MSLQRLARHKSARSGIGRPQDALCAGAGAYLLCLALVAVLSFPGGAGADEYRPAYLQLTETRPDTFEAMWKAPARGDRRLRLDAGFTPAVEVTAPVRSSFIPGAYIERWTFRSAGGLAGSRVVIDGLPGLSTEVLVRIAYLDGATETARLTPASPGFTVAGAPERLEVVNTYLVFGIEHILQGFDHLLFVACLIFIAATWGRILLTVTGFTIAHSITLTMAALGIIGLPIAPIEATIALSIVFLAREIAVGRRASLTWRYPVAVSSLFGLLHGFGFASALREIGLPGNEIPAALLSFNIGVEIGQVLFVSVVLAAFLLLRTVREKSRLAAVVPHTVPEKPVAHAIGAVAMFWTLERMSGFFTV